MKTTRRTFIKAASAAAATLLVPTWKPLISRPPLDIQDFCATDEWSSRYSLQEPFAQKDFTYASDGRICVRTDLIKPDLSTEPRKHPNAAGLRWEHDCLERWNPWPRKNWVADSKPFVACPICYGLKPQGAVDCTVCQGYGFIGEDEKDCTACNSRGWQGPICDYCHLEGDIENKPTLQPVGDLRINGWYDQKIRRLDSVEFAVVKWPSTKYVPDEVVLFRFNGGQGIVMPIADK
jgi:hypothetical protein